MAKPEVAKSVPEAPKIEEPDMPSFTIEVKFLLFYLKEFWRFVHSLNTLILNGSITSVVGSVLFPCLQ